MRFLFTSAQLAGHLDWGGYLKTAAELQRRGHEVLWATGQEVQPLLAAHQVPGHVLSETGWRWPLPPPLKLEPGMDRATYQRLRMVRSLDQWLGEERVEKAGEELIALGETFQPDALVSEMFVAGAGLAAEVLAVPFVVVGWPALQTKLPPKAQFVAEMAQERLAHLFEHFGVKGENWISEGPPALFSPYMHLTYWSASWFAGLPLLPQNRHVGGIAAKPEPWKTPWLNKLPMDQPWIFITLGTTFSDDLNFFVAAAHAATQVGGLPILAVGTDFPQDKLQALRDKLPGTAVVTTKVNFAEVLPYAAAAIHHGGAGTTHALVTHAVPQIVVPHAADQGRQAEGVRRSGVGMSILPKNVSIPRLVEMLKAVLPDRSHFREQAKTLKAEFAALGGVDTAADLLLEVGERNI